MLKLVVRQAQWLIAVFPIGACIAVTPSALAQTTPTSAVESTVESLAEPLTTQSATTPSTKAATLPIRLEIQLKQRRVTLYQGETKVKSYPIAVGRPGWETPKGSYKVQQRIEKPTWVHPLTGEVVKGGDPENPLGKYWLGFWTDGKNWIGFHGTPTPKSVGTAASHGCIRMYNKDISELFAKIPIGTEVTVRD
ncbi:MAG: L,D-transpeptidase [Myxacorys chilensis ATA2-1-KO14]|jgi:lipoprotein-anchoring transpeptidase ErfK/SrfK|nr:L,D-transpeptidase [Myxacorys chilensis ATA2-1-KO14]